MAMAFAKETLTSHNFDEFATITHPMKKRLHVLLLNFKRINNRFAFPILTHLYVAIIVLVLDCIGSTIAMVVHIRAGDLDAITFTTPGYSTGLVLLIRGLTLLFKAKDIAAIFNELDGLFPQNEQLQRRMQVPRYAASVKRRFRNLFRGLTVAYVLFAGGPLIKFALHRHEYEEVAPEFHQCPTWMPFGMKKSYKLYPFVYLFESVQRFHSISMAIEWDQVFTVIVSQLCMHFEYLQLRIIELNAKETKNGVKSKEFYENLKQCIAYHQRLNRLGYALNSIFNVSILVSDMMTSTAICMQLYLAMGSKDIVTIVEKLQKIALLVYVTYDVAKQGTQLQILSSDIKEALYNHNWYEGSTYYRKYVAMWMQHANKPYRLIAFETFEVNMAHFQDFVMLAYQMLTFLKSSQ